MSRSRLVLASILLAVLLGGFLAYRYIRDNTGPLAAQVAAERRLPNASPSQAGVTYRIFHETGLLEAFVSDATTSETLTTQTQCKAMSTRLAALGSPTVVLYRVSNLPDSVVVSFASAVVKQEVVTLHACLSRSDELHALEGRLRNDVSLLVARLQEDHSDA